MKCQQLSYSLIQVIKAVQAQYTEVLCLGSQKCAAEAPVGTTVSSQSQFMKLPPQVGGRIHLSLCCCRARFPIFAWLPAPRNCLRFLRALSPHPFPTEQLTSSELAGQSHFAKTESYVVYGHRRSDTPCPLPYSVIRAQSQATLTLKGNPFHRGIKRRSQGSLGCQCI